MRTGRGLIDLEVVSDRASVGIVSSREHAGEFTIATVGGNSAVAPGHHELTVRGNRHVWIVRVSGDQIRHTEHIAARVALLIKSVCVDIVRRTALIRNNDEIAEKIQIVVDEGAKAKYDYYARLHLLPAWLSGAFYAIALLLILWVTFIQSLRIARATGWLS